MGEQSEGDPPLGLNPELKYSVLAFRFRVRCNIDTFCNLSNFANSLLPNGGRFSGLANSSLSLNDDAHKISAELLQQ